MGLQRVAVYFLVCQLFWMLQTITTRAKKVLLTYKGLNLAVLEAEEVWKPNKVKEAKASYGTTSVEHPSVKELFEDLGKYYVGGKVHGLQKGFEAVWGAGFKP